LCFSIIKSWFLEICDSSSNILVALQEQDVIISFIAYLGGFGGFLVILKNVFLVSWDVS